MKKILMIFAVIASVAIIMCSCSKSDKVDVGEEATVTQVQNGEKSEQAHLTDNGYVNKMDHLDSKGNVVYTEEYVYDDEGNVTDYVYRDKDGKFIARYNLEKSKFYNKAKLEMSENDFMQALHELGADN
ncbi:MAG: hypothetical protein IJU45_07495 [Clostridia bacterium]|nr:hypothetical protein [Clostridia bacterium]